MRWKNLHRVGYASFLHPQWILTNLGSRGCNGGYTRAPRDKPDPLAIANSIYVAVSHIMNDDVGTAEAGLNKGSSSFHKVRGYDRKFLSLLYD